MLVRDACPIDAAAACAVLRRSITALCTADHRGDPAILREWLRNKRPDQFQTWLGPGNSVLVAVTCGAIVGVGAVTDAGMITLNYVAPGARFQGVSRAMLAALERRASERGNGVCRLHSTRTALAFYEAQGYVRDGAAVSLFGASGQPMRKPLAPT